MSETIRTPGSPRGLFAVLAIAAVLVLAGCVGIPTSGGVREGDVVHELDEIPYALLPSGPQEDASQKEILTDFMQAATAPEGNYEIARQFLAPAAAETWNPNGSTLIREGPAMLMTLSESVIDYSVSTKASVNSDGLYREDFIPVSQRLNFRFEQIEGQWRISSLDDGTVLSRDNFDAVFDSHTLYFFDPSYRYLIPDVRWFPARSIIATRIASALLAGQASWLQQGATLTAFPQGTRLAAVPVDVRSGLARVDLTKEAAAATPIERARMQQQLLTSLGTANVSSVTMTVSGAPLEVADPGVSGASVGADVDSAPLVRQGDRFGFATINNIDLLSRLSSKVVGLDARAVSLARSKVAAAVLGAGGAYLVTANGETPLLVDSRGGLIAPSIDPFDFVWSVPTAAAEAIHATGVDGLVHPITSAIPAGARMYSLEISSDGARVLIYLSTDAGPRLYVAAIIRRDGVPTELGELVELPASPNEPVDATWVDNRTVATLSKSSTGEVVTAFGVGGPRESLGRPNGGLQIVGGSGSEQIRVLTSTGTILQRRASGWQSTGITADVLATQQ